MNDPKCRHRRAGIVTSGPYVAGEPHAVVSTCARPACIEDAKLWANRTVLARTAEFVPDGPR